MSGVNECRLTVRRVAGWAGLGAPLGYPCGGVHGRAVVGLPIAETVPRGIVECHGARGVESDNEHG